MKCSWCENTTAKESVNTVYWELPDGTKTVQIEETPCVCCSACGMTYQTEDTVKQIEDQLFLIDTKQLPKILSFEDLMKRPRLLKRNYFDFST
ncbi:YokU family protein [Ectobacillus panaciterrae]|uniref:YokU family protein n=1 Tax=Ectobacillus panaciterrae TaxID=363872 RepID=UPI000428FA41|nr:YokU family protein [Ectobacillus panaciterrae]